MYMGHYFMQLYPSLVALIDRIVYNFMIIQLRWIISIEKKKKN